MGKKTTAFIDSITALQEKFKAGSMKYITSCETLAKLDVQQFGLEEKRSARVAELRKTLNGPALNNALQNDPAFVKLNLDIHTFTELGRMQVEMRRDAADGLTVIAGRMPGTIATFEKYIQKKAKSKNPFKSKKSIPAAKDFIDTSKTFADAAVEFCNDTLKMKPWP